MWCGCGTHYLGVWLVGGAFVPEGPLKKLAPMTLNIDAHCQSNRSLQPLRIIGASMSEPLSTSTHHDTQANKYTT